MTGGVLGPSPARVLQGALAVWVCAFASGCATTPAKDQSIVKELEIEGTKQVDEDAIKKKILTTEPAWPWETEIFDPNAWQADLRRVERFYETQGYYQARVVEDEIKPVAPNAVSLRIKVQENEPTRLTEIRIEGMGSLTPEQRAVALTEFPLKEGEIFLEERWTAVKPSLRARLREMGYAEATVEGTVEVDVDTRTARALIEVTPGQRYKFGEIFVATDANPRVPPKWIIEEARVAVEKGAWYSESALADAQSRVFKMGVFGGVKVNPGAPHRPSGTVPVVIDVREAPFRTIRAGGGIGLDQSRNEVRGLVEYTNRNFFGGLRQFNASLRAGYAFLPSFVDVVVNNPSVTRISEPVANLTSEFSQPRLFGLPSLRGFVALEGELRPEQAYTVLGGQAKTGVAFLRPTAWSRFAPDISQLSYNFEAYHFLRPEEGALGQVGGRRPLLVLGCEDDPCILSFLETQLEWDRRARRTASGPRPDPVDPTTGYYLALSLQYGGGPLGGSFSYLRVLPEARAYVSILEDDRLTFAFRARGGTLISEEESPIVARFYAGGGTSMRGYNNRRLSPLLLVPPDTENTRARDGQIAPAGRTQGDVIPIGGERLFEGSVEARYRLNPDFIFALFYDVGFNNRGDRFGNDLTLENAPTYFQTYLQHAVGVGLRYVTLVGPIRVDLAYKLPFGTPPRVYEFPGTYLVPPAGGGCFGLGDRQRGPTVNPEGRCALHISIGEAF